MKSIRIPGLCLVATLLVSMVATGSALAEQKLPPKPFFGQCQKVLIAKAGNADDAQCSTTAKNEKEWIEVVGGETECRETVTKEAGNKIDAGCTKTGKGDYIQVAEPVETFSSTSGIGVLETVGGTKVECAKDKNVGRIIGPSQVRIFVTFTGCGTEVLGKREACTSSGANVEEIKTKELSGQLRYIKEPATTEVGLQLKPASGELFAEFTCAGVSIKVKGAIIGKVTSALNTYSRTGTVRFKQTKGKQEPEKFEGGVKETLESTNLFGTFEQSGEDTTDNIEFQDDTQIIA